MISERMANVDSGEAFNVGQFLEESSPYAWAATGVGLCIGLSVLGAGWCVCCLDIQSTTHSLFCWPSSRGIFITGASILGGGVRTPRITTKNLIRYLVAKALYSNKLNKPPQILPALSSARL